MQFVAFDSPSLVTRKVDISLVRGSSNSNERPEKVGDQPFSGVTVPAICGSRCENSVYS